MFLADRVTEELCIHSAYGESAPRLHELRIPAGVGIVGQAMQTRQVICVDDAQKDPRFYPLVDKQTGWITRALIAAPLLDGEDCLGVIEFLNPLEKDCFSEQDERMVEYFASLVSASLVRIRSHEAAIERAHVQRDLDLAREIQAGLLPTTFPSQQDFPGLDLFATLEPATEVSGDLYDFFPAGDGRIFFLIGDVAGKGVAAGLFMAVTRTLIRSTARHCTDPAEILRQVNAQIEPENQALLFVTIILGLYDPGTGRIEYAQGGHVPALVLEASGRSSFEPPSGQLLGVFSEPEFVSSSRTLQPGDTFLIYTDGVTEAMDASCQLYGDQRLQDSMQTRHFSSARQVVQQVLQGVRSFVGNASQSDDIAILALRRCAA